MSCTLPLNDAVTLPRILLKGGAVNFHSRTVNLTPDPKPKVDNIALNLMGGNGDYLLHISFRRREDAVVFNSRRATSPWGPEERIALRGIFTQGEGTKVTVTDSGASYRILVDGRVVHTYNKRLPQPQAASVGYTMNPDATTLMLSHDLEVDMRDPSPPAPPRGSYESSYFPLTAADVENETFDIVIIGSGIGGGVLASDLWEKNHKLMGKESFFTEQSTPPVMRMPNKTISRVQPEDDDKSLRILVIERGGLLFHTHSLNGPRPTSRGTYGQMNDYFYNQFKDQFDMDESTAKIWKGGPVFALGGRSTVWGLFSPRISMDTFEVYFPSAVYNDLDQKYLPIAEETMKVAYPETRPLHRALIDRLNLRDRRSKLPRTQWMWGRIASEFHDPRNFDFAEGAYSTVDKLLEAAMNDPKGEGKFKTILRSQVSRLEPAPTAGKLQTLRHVVVKNGDAEHKIRCKKAVICAGAVESAAILLRSASGMPLEAAYGASFARDFGHVTDHYIFYVTMPFFYHDMARKDSLGGIKLQTDITFTDLDNSTALANISLDASSFLPRRNVPDSELPQFIIAYILPCALAPQNKVELDKEGEPRISVGYANDPNITYKKEILVDFAVDVTNKIADVLDIQFAQKDGDNYYPYTTITKADLTLGELGPGGVAHELGSIPMPDKEGNHALVDSDLKMKYGWDNVYVCDLSVFPYSAAANPTLTLAALALRLSDKLVSEKNHQPILVYNLTKKDVYVQMTLCDDTEPNYGTTTRTCIPVGEYSVWKRMQREAIFIYDCLCAKNYELQTVYPGVNALIVTSPPSNKGCVCNTR